MSGGATPNGTPTGCISCDEGAERCPSGQRECGHHCNHSWSHDRCCWCGKTFGEVGGADATSDETSTNIERLRTEKAGAKAEARRAWEIVRKEAERADTAEQQLADLRAETEAARG